MARASLMQNAVNAGELSALLLGRQDIAKYASGLYVCLNGIPLTQGAWTRRPGTAYLHQTRHHDKLSRLIPFQYSIEQTYILEFGEGYIRFYTDHGILTTVPRGINSVSQALPAALVYQGTDPFEEDGRVYIVDNEGMTQINNREFVVKNLDAGTNAFDLYETDGTTPVNSTDYGALTSGGTVAHIVEVETLFQEADLADIRVTQSADTLYIFHPDYPPQVLTRSSATTWTLRDLGFANGPYGDLNDTDTTLSPSAATGTVTITASSVEGINDDEGFLSTDEGRIIRIQEGSTWGWVEILTVSSTVSVVADVKTTLTNTNAKTNWRLGLWSDTTGWPTCATFNEDRLFIAGAVTTPQRLDGSRTGRYQNFSPSANDGTVADDHAVAFTLNSDDVNAIKWMGANEKGMLVGTGRGEWLVKASALNEALTPTNISAKPCTKRGSADAAPVFVGNAALFIQRAKRKLREIAFVFEADGFKSPDMTLLSEHITRPSLEEIVYQEQPQAIIWGRRSDGVLLGFTYERDQDVVAWHRHELGGYSDEAQGEIPQVESMAVVPSPDASRDECYMIVQRYVNGQERRSIEYLSKMWEYGDEQEDAIHLDCSWTVVNDPVTDEVSGLWFLEGETLTAYVDGAVHPDVTVENGVVTLDRTGTVVTLGYAYQSDAQTLPSEGGSNDGTSQGKTKRIAEIAFWLMDTLGFKYGPDFDNLTELIEAKYAGTFATPTALLTGVVRDRFEGEHDMLGQVCWRCEGPFPATVLAAMPKVKVSDG